MWVSYCLEGVGFTTAGASFPAFFTRHPSNWSRTTDSADVTVLVLPSRSSVTASVLRSCFCFGAMLLPPGSCWYRGPAGSEPTPRRPADPAGVDHGVGV